MNRDPININKVFAIGNRRYDATPVLLPPVSDEMVMDEQLEPQLIRKRHGNISWIFLDSNYSSSTYNGNSSFILQNTYFIRKIQRFAFSSMNYTYVTPNINPNNQVVSFQSSNTGSTIYSVSIPEAFYLTSASFVTAFIAALNTVTGASGLTFTDSLLTDGSNRGTITAAGGTYVFTPSSFMKYGENVAALPLNDSLSATKNIGPIFLIYSRYIDINSSSLTQFTKNPNVSNSPNNSNLLTRIDVTNPAQHIAFFTFTNTAWFNFNKSMGLDNIDIQLIDEYGFPLYIPAYATANFYVLITFLAEL
jgi:hypothetical protein